MRPANFAELPKGYSYIVSEETAKYVKPPKPDRFELFQTSFIIYKDKQGDSINNQALDMHE